MRNSNNSKKIIFNTAKKLFWTKGYSNVSVRDIAKQSKYDIALISRYFGSKKKLFEETLKDVAEWFVDVNPNNVVDFMVEGLMENSNPKDDVNLVRMLCMNSGDPEVGHIVKKFHREKMRKPVIDGIKKKIKPINYGRLLCKMQGKEGYERRCRSDNEKRKKSNERLLPFVRNWYVQNIR